MSTNQRLELLNDTLQQSQTIVFSESRQKVLENFVLFTSGGNLQFLNDLVLVAHAQGGGIEDSCKLGVLLEDFAELRKRFGNRVERGCLCGGSVLFLNTRQRLLAFDRFWQRYKVVVSKVTNGVKPLPVPIVFVRLFSHA